LISSQPSALAVLEMLKRRQAKAQDNEEMKEAD
jgi:hypothetical protein